MKKILTGALAALTLGGAALGAAVPASAEGWHDHDGWRGGYGYRGGGGAGLAIGAGILGLAVGSALANDHPRYYGGGYGGYGYYGAPAYYPAPTYYEPYRPYAYAPACRSHWRWDGLEGRYVLVERCW